MAATFETLRLYHPLLTFTKSTGNLPRTVTYHSNQLYLPPDTIILPNLLGIKCHPRYWGSDRLLWRPSRWIEESTNPKMVKRQKDYGHHQEAHSCLGPTDLEDVLVRNSAK
ncbi:1454450c-9878-426c-ac12-0571a921e259-CDS [Sclerotinia trifoliorum]|uniref:1454450c-9878-426c-ac12-0571a921e259-CDS n=1 Tax=Sclerotinia trifoliorum TaxID=28548 RepID=A0A8H2ZPE4_9HELO|nr:1454450c-9878-426c-ac12-0571a921e259-CDS [Sclerotinia trifoliorum]